MGFDSDRSYSLLVAALTDNPDLAYAAFVVSGIGMAAILPLNSFQIYHIFPSSVKRKHTITTINNYNDNDNETVAAPPPPPLVCTGCYDNCQKVNAAAMIGQIIILSVTCFVFHFNYKWVLVTGSAASGIATCLGILLIVAKPCIYKFFTSLNTLC
jgi:hypothetical protein